MIRRIIEIDREKCNGCGLCVTACHEGAIALIGGKAYLAREHYCDGLGDCLPGCPTGAITFVEREAPAYDEAAVKKAKEEKAAARQGCPGSRTRERIPQAPTQGSCPSQLRQWPVQIKLVPVQAPWLEGADLLIAADCTGTSLICTGHCRSWLGQLPWVGAWGASFCVREPGQPWWAAAFSALAFRTAASS